MTALLHLWSNWASGNSVANSDLWGHSVMFWGRVGKVAQFFGAMAVVAELIGPERLRKFGRSLHSAFSYDALGIELRYSRDYLSTWRRFTAKTAEEEERDRLALQLAGNATQDVNLLVSLLPSAFLLAYVWRHHSLPIFVACVPVALALFPLCTMTVGPYAAVIVRTGWSFLWLAFDWLVIRPTAWFLELERVDRWIKVAALLLIVIGFHFDLLAS